MEDLSDIETDISNERVVPVNSFVSFMNIFIHSEIFQLKCF